MELIPKNIKIPHIGTTQEQDDPKVVIKLFHPCSSWTWYVIEYDPSEELAFGLVDGHEIELGYFSIAELRELRVRGLSVERDMYWDSMSLSQLKKQLGQ